MDNNGPNTANNVTISHLLNHNHLKGISDDGKGSYNHITGIWSVQTIENGTNINLHVVAQIIASNINITSNAIYKSGLNIDPNISNNMTSTTLKIPPSADISITQSASNYNPKNFHNIYIKIKVKNQGHNDAQNLTINSGLNPDLLKYISCYGNGIQSENRNLDINKLKIGAVNTLYN